MQRVRFTSRPDAKGALKVEDLPSGRVQFRSAETGQAQPQQLELPLEADVEAYVEDNLRAATQEGEAAGALDFEAMEHEFEEQGALSEESYRLLTAAGIPRHIVERYIEGQSAVSQRLVQEAHEIAGGEKRFQAVMQWAQSHLPEEELATYLDAINATPARARFAIQGLCAAHQRATGAPPRLTRGEAGPVGQGAFTSAQDVADAIKDPRYKKDPAYRSQVAARLSKSRVF